MTRDSGAAASPHRISDIHCSCSSSSLTGAEACFVGQVRVTNLSSAGAKLAISSKTRPGTKVFMKDRLSSKGGQPPTCSEDDAEAEEQHHRTAGIFLGLDGLPLFVLGEISLTVGTNGSFARKRFLAEGAIRRSPRSIDLLEHEITPSRISEISFSENPFSLFRPRGHFLRKTDLRDQGLEPIAQTIAH